MEESKSDKDECLVGNSSEYSRVAESEEQTLEQVQGTFVEGFEDGSCNGDDLMVEVLGSEVYVGGVSSSGSREILDETLPADKNEPLAGDGSEKEDSLEVKDRVFVAVEAQNSEMERIKNACEGIEKEGSVLVSESVEENDQNLDSCEMERIGNEAREESVFEMESVVLGVESDREVLVEGPKDLTLEEGTGVEEARVLEENAVLMSCELENSADLGEEERDKSEIGNGVIETEVAVTEVVLEEEERVNSEIGNGCAGTIHGSEQVAIETEVTVTEVALDSETHSGGENSTALGEEEVGNIHGSDQVVIENEVSVTEVTFDSETHGGGENSAALGEEEMGNIHGSDQVLVETEVTVTEVVSVSEPDHALINDLTGDIELMEEEIQVTQVEEVKFESEDRPEVEVNEVESQRESPVNEDSVPETDNRVGDYVNADEVMISEMDLLEYNPYNTDQKDNPEEAVVKEEKVGIESPEPEYDLPPEQQGDEFSVLPDLVWGKVKSHPWWPGQIFDSTDASEKALKHHKKDCLLVAYFGDRTFAWNEESTLKSFRAHFSQMVSQSNGETFHKAVGCALEEVSRRVELGLACPCVAGDWYEDIRVQTVENAGIRPESSQREGVDGSVGAGFFRPENLVEYIRSLAQCPSPGGSDDLGLTIAKAQLLSYSRFRGYCRLPEFQFCGELAENGTAGPEFQENHREEEEEEASSSQEMIRAKNRSSLKRKHNLRDGVYPKVKEKSLSELMGLDYPDEEDDHDHDHDHDHHVSGKRRRSSGDDETKTISMAKVSPTPPKQSFKIGECIRRVASQMAVKGNSNPPESVSTEYSSLDELLVQLQLIARDPRREYSFSNVIVNFFSDFRNSAVSAGLQLSDAEKSGGKRKRMSPETFEFDDMIDTYWTDRVIQNGAAEEQPPQQQQPPPSLPAARKGRKKDNQLSLVEKTPRQYNRKKNLTAAGTASSPEKQKPLGYVNDNAPAELVINFSDARSVPPEAVLSRMFRRFGPLKEAETEVDIECRRARVVFRKCSDAEVAFNSAGKFSIFGNIPVNYQLNYTPTAQFKTVPLLVTLDRDMQLALAEHDHQIRRLDHNDMDLDIQLDLSGLSAFEVNLA